MKTIEPHLWRPLFDAVYEMNIAKDHADFASAVTVALHRLIPADTCHVHVMDRANERVLQHAYPNNPFNDEEIAYYAAHPEDNAFIAYYERTGDTRARRLSDVTDAVAYRRTEFYRRCLQRCGFKYTLALPLTINDHTIAALAFDRRRVNFTRQHCALLDAFAPHFLLAWQKQRNPWRQQRKKSPPARERLRALGLTPREADVLFWMTEGKQNREIATILGRSLETIQEHVGNVVRKLGQENRHAATVFALRRLSRHPA